MRLWPTRALSIGAVLTMIMSIGVAGAAPASAHDVPGDQPLPGYTINHPPLAPALVGGVPTTVHSGVHAHAAYDIEIPPQWNGDLVMWTHGYRGQGFVLTVDPPAFGLRQRLLDQGYAWAASSYYGNGFDIEAGVLSTKDLAELFRDTVGEPDRIYIAGVSMGGYIIGRSLEEYSGFYAGALPMCGVMGDQKLLDFFLDYNVVAQAIAGVHEYPVPADYLSRVVPPIQVALGLAGLSPVGPDTTNDLGKQLRAITINRSGGPRPGGNAAFAVWKDFLFGIAVPQSPGTTLAQDPGQLSTNMIARYDPNAPVNVNATVQRVFPRNMADRYNPELTQVPLIYGRPTVPVLSVHGLGDMFVPFSMEQMYRVDVERSGRTKFLVQRAIRTAQHCEYSNAEIGTAWDDLVRWVDDGPKPAGDDVRTASVVANANYGCAFSDRAAWQAGVGTRRLYAACP